MWESLALKFFHRWEAGVWDVEALGSESGDKLAFYRCLKDLPEAEPYARANLPVRTRRVLAGLRAGCLPLQVELGRYSCPKTPFNERLCKMCMQQGGWRSKALSVTLYQSQNPTSCALGWDIWAQPRLHLLWQLANLRPMHSTVTHYMLMHSPFVCSIHMMYAVLIFWDSLCPLLYMYVYIGILMHWIRKIVLYSILLPLLLAL